MCKRFNDSAKENLIFFGAFHLADPTNFAFHIGDRLLIKKLVAEVKQKIDSDGYKYYHLQESRTKKNRKLKDTVETQIGIFFGPPLPVQKNAIHSPENKDSLIESLYRKVAEQFSDFATKKTAFTKAMCDVQIDDITNTVNGLVTCIYCESPKHVYFDAPYWVLSNFKSHVLMCSKKMSSATDSNLRNAPKKRSKANLLVEPKKNANLNNASKDSVGNLRDTSKKSRMLVQ